MPSNRRVFLLKSNIGRLGGVEKVTLRLALAFEQRGCAVSLVTSGSIPNSLHLPSIPTLSYQSKLGLGMSATHVLGFDHFCKRHTIQHRPDIIFGMDRNRFQTHLRAGNGVHAAYLKHRSQTEGLWKRMSFALNPLHHLLLSVERQSFESTHLRTLFTNSHLVKQEILEYYKTDPKKIEVIHNGVEWEEMAGDFSRWQEGKRELCERLCLDPHVFHFVFIGHNFQRKGLDKLLLGLSQLKHESFHLSVVGKDKQAPFFTAMSRTLGLEKRVTFFGAQKNQRPFYQLADALVIPSIYDPFANVTVEALAMGVFVVSSLTNGGHEVLTPQIGAKIASLSSVDASVEALKTALKHPKTPQTALVVRNSVRYLDFSHQMEKFVSSTLDGDV